MKTEMKFGDGRVEIASHESAGGRIKLRLKVGDHGVEISTHAGDVRRLREALRLHCAGSDLGC